MPDAVAQFANANYLNLETFRKSGIGVCTPVWFAQAPAQSDAMSGPAVFYVYSEADAGKVKRVRNNPKVRVAPCDMRGNLRGAWVDARARICATGKLLGDSNCCGTSIGSKLSATFSAGCSGTQTRSLQSNLTEQPTLATRSPVS